MSKINRPIQNQQGFTLIELMISSFLGLMVIGGLYGMFAINKEAIRIQSTMGLAQEQANFALEVIAEDIRKAGWPGPFSVGAFNPVMSADPANGVVGDNLNAYDSIVLSRRGRGADPTSLDPLVQNGEIDCLGVIRDFDALNVPLSHLYFVDPDTQQLKCRSLISGDEIAMVENVEAFQVLYGVDTTPGPCANVDPNIPASDATVECMSPSIYVRGDELLATLAQARTDFLGAGVDIPATVNELVHLKTIQLAIVVSTDEVGIIDDDQATSLSFSLLGQDIGHGIDGADYSDRSAKRMAIRTIALKQAYRP